MFRRVSSATRRPLGKLPSGLLAIFTAPLKSLCLLTSFLGTSGIFFRYFSVILLDMSLGKDCEFVILVGILHWMSTATSPREGRDFRRTLCGPWHKPAARFPGVNSIEFRRLWSGRPSSLFLSKDFLFSASWALASFSFKLYKSSMTVWNSVLLEEQQELAVLTRAEVFWNTLCATPDISMFNGVRSFFKARAIWWNGSPLLVMPEMLQGKKQQSRLWCNNRKETCGKDKGDYISKNCYIEA